MKITILLEDEDEAGGTHIRLMFPNVPLDIAQLQAGVRNGRLLFEHEYSEPERFPGPVPDSFVVDLPTLLRSEVTLRFKAEPGQVGGGGREYVYLWELLREGA